MPVNIAPSDKRLLTWAAIVVTVLIIAVALLSDEEEESGVPTTYSSQSSGARAAYLLLKETGHHVERWEEAHCNCLKLLRKPRWCWRNPLFSRTKKRRQRSRIS